MLSECHKKKGLAFFPLTGLDERAKKIMLNQEKILDLMQRAKAGEEEAFALLYEDLYTPIFRYVYSKMSDKAQAEDLTQTVFMKAFKARERFADDASAPVAYFFTIARNLLTDTYRKKKEVHISTEDDQDFFAEIPDKELDPAKAHAETENKKFMQSLLQELKPVYREVIELKFIAGYANRDIAQRLGKSEANIRQIQVRALRKLKDLLYNVSL